MATANRRRRLRGLLAPNGDDTSSALTRICLLAASELSVTGAGVTLIDRAGHPDAQQRLVLAGDPVAARLEELQFTVGEGPGLAAATDGVLVLVPDLAAAVSRWPGFTPGALAAGAAAVFAFPLTLGAIGVGSLDCYRSSAGRLNDVQVSDALLLAELAFEAVLAQIAGHTPEDLGWIGDIHAEVHQASGIVSYEQNLSMQAALLRIRAYAYAHDLPVSVVARQLVTRSLALDAEE
ncbi:ANTAR domain-containing protein [Amycolatopsis sp. K13G38]|uniref:ANTAR domain-containing protein n=1 Tax=Amycolatopsis acididurans TaxID=2724524 RepID=A0ABX1JEP9_9PSEU|nr:ANTAR domain-containing protein [Amycolatopsis acididurans]NKQ57339.1 ANTAR domain-containing protein [Amycolatopsis acididurans]